VRAIARGAQEQIATFFAIGWRHGHPPGARTLLRDADRRGAAGGLNFITGPLPKTLLTISNVTVTASDTGTVTAVFTVSLSAPSSQPVTVITPPRTARDGRRQRLCPDFRDAHLRPRGKRP
jgi:hypothetical protein